MDHSINSSFIAGPDLEHCWRVQPLRGRDFDAQREAQPTVNGLDENSGTSPDPLNATFRKALRIN